MSFASIRRYLKTTRAYPILSAIAWRVHRAHDFIGTKLWKRTSVATTPLGFKLALGSHPAYALMRSGDFEVEETRIVTALLDRTDVFIDVGANLGYYSFLALQRQKRVVAFEPQQQNLRRLFRGLALNGWDDAAEVFPMALGAKPGLLTLYGASGPSASLIRNWAGYSPRFRQIVAATTLDDVIAHRFGGSRLLIKIDVEGAEHAVLQGAAATLGREPRPVWLVEICLGEFHPGGPNPHYLETFELFWKAGYRAWTAAIPPAEVAPVDVRRWSEAGRCDAGTFNYLFASAEVPVEEVVRTGRMKL